MGEAAEGKSGSCSPEQAASLPAGSGIPGRRGVLGSPARFSRVHGGFRVGGSGASYFSAGWTEGNPRPPPALSVLGFGPCASRAGALRRTFANWALLHRAVAPQVLEFVHTCSGWKVLRFGRPRTPPPSPPRGPSPGTHFD